MKKILVTLAVIIFMSAAGYVYAQQPGMMGYGPGMMGPCMGMGYGPGMMGGSQGWYGCGPGMTMGGYQGQCGPGMMGWGTMGPGMGQYQQPQKALEEKDAKVILENYLQTTRNPNLKLGKIKDTGSAFEAEIVTKENSLVDKITVDKNTGWMHSAY